ncbi:MULTISPECIES: hypothetical protein [unclassified Microcoleus]|uniref:hypothetical protein n=1 Tax=unclassified Microcoleus TaxID=2642155 RepID=UPI002FD4887B
MKIIELESGQTLDEALALAKGEAVVLRQPDGKMFALAPIDDFEFAVELLKKNT